MPSEEPEVKPEIEILPYLTGDDHTNLIGIIKGWWFKSWSKKLGYFNSNPAQAKKVNIFYTKSFEFLHQNVDFYSKIFFFFFTPNFLLFYPKILIFYTKIFAFFRPNFLFFYTNIFAFLHQNVFYTTFFVFFYTKLYAFSHQNVDFLHQDFSFFLHQTFWLFYIKLFTFLHHFLKQKFYFFYTKFWKIAIYTVLDYQRPWVPLSVFNSNSTSSKTATVRMFNFWTNYSNCGNGTWKATDRLVGYIFRRI